MERLNLKNYELILLDWDGTLINSRNNVIYAMQYVSQKFRNIDWFELDKTRNKNLSLEDNFENFFGNNKTLAYDLYLRNYIDGIKNNVKRMSHAVKLLQFLDDFNIKKAVVTSKDRRLWEQETMLFDTTFDFSVCKDECEHNKPYPDPLIKAIKYFSIPNSKVLMIGDSEHDYLSAERTGIASIIIGNKYDNALHFENIGGLIQILIN